MPNGDFFYLWSDGHDDLTNHLADVGLERYEPHTLSVFASLAARARVVLDVGSNVGVYSVVAAKINRDARVYAFEPVAAAFDRLRTNVVLNRLGNVTCVRAAVADSSGRTPIFFHAEGIDTVSSQYVDHRTTWDDRPSCCEFVPSVSIDEFASIAEIDALDLVKIDVEKGEAPVVRGMAIALGKHRPSIVCEVFPPDWAPTAAATAEELEQTLQPLGYNFYLLTDDGPVLRHGIKGDATYLNHLFSVMSPDDLHEYLSGSNWSAN